MTEKGRKQNVIDKDISPSLCFSEVNLRAVVSNENTIVWLLF